MLHIDMTSLKVSWMWDFGQATQKYPLNECLTNWILHWYNYQTFGWKKYSLGLRPMSWLKLFKWKILEIRRIFTMRLWSKQLSHLESHTFPLLWGCPQMRFGKLPHYFSVTGGITKTVEMGQKVSHSWKTLAIFGRLNCLSYIFRAMPIRLLAA